MNHNIIKQMAATVTQLGETLVALEARVQKLEHEVLMARNERDDQGNELYKIKQEVGYREEPR